MTSSVATNLRDLLEQEKSSPKKEHKQSCMLVGNGSPTSVTARLYSAQKDFSLNQVIVRRKTIDASMHGAIQDFLASRDSWKSIELTTASRATQRLLHGFLYVRHVERLIIVQPSDAVISMLGTSLLNNTDGYATVDSLTVISGTIASAQAYGMKEGLSSPLCPLQYIRLTKCSFENIEAVRNVAIGLKNCKALKEVSLCQCHLEDTEIATIVTELKDHPSLQHLDLSVNYCLSEGMKAVGALLASSTHLKYLDISCQDVWDDRDYFIHLCDGLEHEDCMLEVLDTHSNFLADDQMKWLVKALEKNTTLQRLLLFDNSISDQGMMCLSDSLPVLPRSLRILDISNNSYSMQGVKSLEKGMARNTSIWKLKLNDSTMLLEYYLALNSGGRCLKLTNTVGLSLWPHILERTNRCLSYEQLCSRIGPQDVIFDLLHGPALLDG
ncbi:unnamed protein product [Cylindrotheca closterium]|uniref:Uncharacterized protein n=1 Tax=Cylindrotheca closterium TaxID=2856 RepID=A0AAD2G4F5_9STRA|nr:unnamed protein product [Cylindrotheca closterium]